MQDERLPLCSGMLALSFASCRWRRRGWKLTTASSSPSHDACAGPKSSSLVRTAAYCWLLLKSMPGKIDRAGCCIGVGAASMSVLTIAAWRITSYPAVISSASTSSRAGGLMEALVAWLQPQPEQCAEERHSQRGSPGPPRLELVAVLRG